MAKITSLPERQSLSISEFISQLYPDADGTLVLWNMSTKLAEFFNPSSLGNFETRVNHLAETSDVFFGFCLQPEEIMINKDGSKRGTELTATVLPGFFMDVDVGTEGHSARNYPPNKEALKEIFRGFPLSPTVIIHTGGGFHLYYLFREPWILEDQREREDAKELLGRFQDTIINLARKHGFNLDKTADLARLLRLPNTFNHKTGTPRPVSVFHVDLGKRYNPHDIEQYLVEVTPEPALITAVPARSEQLSLPSKTGNGAQDRWETLMTCTFLRHCRDDAASLPEPEWYAAVSILSSVRPGGIELCHQISEGYPAYSKSETDKKIIHAMGTPPFTCRYIRDTLGFDCGKNCCVKSPAALVYLGKEGAELSLDAAKAVCSEAIEKFKVTKDHSEINRDEVLAAFASVKRSSPAEYYRFQQELIGLKVRIKAFEKAVDSLMPSRNTDDYAGSLDITDMEKQWSLLNQIKAPDGYLINDNGLFKVNRQDTEKHTQFSYFPTLITAKIRHVDQNLEELQLSYRRPDGWKSVKVARGAAMNARKLIDLADQGFPVTSENASEMANYLAAFEASNYSALPGRHASGRLGWNQVKGKQVFLLPEVFIDSTGTIISLVDDGVVRENPSGELLSFSSDLAGYLEGVKGFTTGGTFDAWKLGVDKVKKLPAVTLLLVEAFAPVLLNIIKGPNFLTNLGEESSTGKTTALMLSGSVWGNPDPRSGNSILRNWNQTAVHLERIASITSGLPLFLDDTKEVKKPDEVSKVVYMLANGQGRGRGKVRGIDGINVWRTIGISTGEGAIADLVVDAGARVRCIDVPGLPFGRKDPETAKLVNDLKATVIQNYGHAGPAFVSELIKRQAEWKSYSTRFGEVRKKFSEKISSGMEDRIAEYGAVIDFTADLVNELLGLGIDKKPAMELFQNSGKVAASEAPVEIRAMNQLSSWIHANGHLLDDSGKKSTPVGGWAGVCKLPPEKAQTSFRLGEKEGPNYIALFPDRLDSMLREWSFEPSAVKRGWRGRGWLDTDDGQRFEKKVSYKGNRARCVVFNRKALEEMGFSLPPEKPEEPEGEGLL